MNKFEYRVWIHRGDVDELEDLLNEEAASGWRLHAITPVINSVVVVFERESIEPAADDDRNAGGEE